MTTPADLFIRINENAVNEILKKHFEYFREVISGENHGFKWELTNQKAKYPNVEFESNARFDAENDFNIQFGLEIKYQPDKEPVANGDIFLIGIRLQLLEKKGKLSLKIKDKPMLIQSFSKDPASKDLFEKFLEVASSDLESYLERIQLPDVSFGVDMLYSTICFFDGNMFILNSLTEFYRFPERFSNTAVELRLSQTLLGRIMKNRMKTPIGITNLDPKKPIKSLSINPDWESIRCNCSDISLDITATGSAEIDELICAINTKNYFNVRFGIDINNQGNDHAIRLSYKSSDSLKLNLVPFPDSIKAFFEGILAIFMTMDSINIDGIEMIKQELTKVPLEIGKIPNVTVPLTKERKMLCSPELSIEYGKNSIILKGDIKTSII